MKQRSHARAASIVTATAVALSTASGLTLVGCGNHASSTSAPPTQTASPIAASAPAVSAPLPAGAPPPQAASFQPYVSVAALPPAPAHPTHHRLKLHLIQRDRKFYLEDSDGHFYGVGRDSNNNLYPIYEDPNTHQDYPLYYDRERDRYYRVGYDSDSRSYYRGYVGDNGQTFYSDDTDYSDYHVREAYRPEVVEDSSYEVYDQGGGTPHHQRNRDAWLLAIPAVIGAYLLLEPHHHSGPPPTVMGNDHRLPAPNQLGLPANHPAGSPAGRPIAGGGASTPINDRNQTQHSAAGRHAGLNSSGAQSKAASEADGITVPNPHHAAIAPLHAAAVPAGHSESAPTHAAPNRAQEAQTPTHAAAIPAGHSQSAHAAPNHAQAAQTPTHAAAISAAHSAPAPRTPSSAKSKPSHGIAPTASPEAHISVHSTPSGSAPAQNTAKKSATIEPVKSGAKPSGPPPAKTATPSNHVISGPSHTTTAPTNGKVKPAPKRGSKTLPNGSTTHTSPESK